MPRLAMALLFCVLIGFACGVMSEEGDANSVVNVDEMKDELSRLKAEIEGLKSGTSTTYIRWGRTSCEGDATVLYTGYAAGTKWDIRGSGANVLCLHDRAQYGTYLEGRQSYVALIFGVEYQVFHSGGWRNNVFSYTNNNGVPLADNPAPCVVCHVHRSTSVMIPARTQCPTGWTKEYHGYIMTECHHHHRSIFNCWDAAPETAAGGFNHDHATVCPTEIRTGSLPLAKYADGRELACVVCTK